MQITCKRNPLWTLMACTVFVLATVMTLSGFVSSAEPVTIYMVEETLQVRAIAQRAVADRFMEENPHIRIEFVSSGGVSPTTMMYTMYAAGVPLDIGFMDPWVALEFARQGMIEDLTPYIERDQEYFQDIPQSLFDLVTLHGKVYGIPIEIQAGAVFYNMQAYDESGVPYPDPTDWTYETIRNHARRLTRVAPDGSVTRYGYRIPEPATGRNWVPAVWAWGGDILDDWVDPTRFTDDPTAIIQALEYFNELVTMGYAQGRVGRPGIYPDFLGQTTALIQTNTFALPEIYTNAEFEFDVMPLPRGPQGQVGAYINAHQQFIFSNSRHKEEAWQVLKYFASYDALAQRVHMTGNMPIRIDVIRNEWLNLPGVPGRHTLLNDLPLGRSPWTLPMQIWQSFGSEAARAVWGDEPATSVVERMERQLTAAIREYRASYGLD